MKAFILKLYKVNGRHSIDIVQIRFLHIIQRVPLEEAVRRVINGSGESNKNI